jgi:putative membrane protein insertion efficiency factor
MLPGKPLRPTTVPPLRALKNAAGPSEKRGTAPFSVRLALAAIRAYQLLIRPMLSGSCRYLPTCSEYAAEAILTYGAARGGWMAVKRILRCHPFGSSGFDPVPGSPGKFRV